MLAQLLAAQFGLEDSITELQRSGAPIDAARSQLQELGDLQRQITAASPAALTSLRGEIGAIVTSSRVLAQQGRAASKAESVELALAATSARTRATVQRLADDLFERRIFDPYLQFDSDEEREAYRRCEAERRAYIDAQLARGTPEGNLNANAATLGQVLDAEAHGADLSPDMQRTKQSLFASWEEQRTAMIAAGRSTIEADRMLAGEVRLSLKRQGLSEAEIDARLDASSNPLDALTATPAQSSREVPAAASAPSAFDDAAAALRAAGVVPPPESTITGHGLSANAQHATQRSGRA